jgi:response regulator RpfG family c-di-GMP phosphodiesterase
MSLDTTSDALLFPDDAPTRPLAVSVRPWKVLIVDDEAEVHDVTRLVLDGFTFKNRGLSFLDAYSGQEARTALAAHPDIDLILLDVVMEDNDTGLALVRHIREELGNRIVRIILRTGQPGQAPEERVVIEYDINDYKEKTELTAQKLVTTVVAALRAGSHLTALEDNRRGLEKVIAASETIFKLQSMELFASGVLAQIVALLDGNRNALLCQSSGFTAVGNHGKFRILAATGIYHAYLNHDVDEVLPREVRRQFARLGRDRTSMLLEGGHYLGVFHSTNCSESIIYLEGCGDLSDLDRKLVEIFSANVSIAFDNIHLNQEVEETQKELIATLGETIEWRSRETGNHVRRVAEYVAILASQTGLPPLEVELLRKAAPMHDVGKVGIPDVILNKPGRLDPSELAVIRTHPSIGHAILRGSGRELFRTASIIALEHHERYDGFGYPQGLTGQGIHVYGRLTAVADVFDALMSDRVYRPAWPLDRVVAYFRDQRGRHFDPVMVDIVLDSLDRFLEVRRLYKD